MADIAGLLYKHISSELVPLDESNAIYVNDFEEKAVADFYKSFHKLNTNNDIKIIPIVIDSFGGTIYSLNAMLDLMLTAVKPIATIATGKAMSCGIILLAAGTKGYRFAGESSDMMVHQVSSGTRGKLTDLVNDVEHTKELNTRLFSRLSKFTGTKDLFKKLLKSNENKDVYLTPKECVKYGIIDHIGIPHLINKGCD